MTDISDPSGASRGDRRAARRTVDDAYASGRISAVDRGLRIEQIDAAATRGDLAMIVRDLAGPAPERRRPATPPIGSAPTPDGGQQPLTPSQADLWERLQREHAAQQDPVAAATPEAGPGLPQTGGYTPAPPTGGTSAPGKPNRALIGCLVAFVAFIFLGPCLLGALGFGLTAFTSDWEFDSSGSSFVEDEPFDEVDGPALVTADSFDWDWMVEALEEEVGSTDVHELEVTDEGATAAVLIDDALQSMSYDGYEWRQVLGSTPAGVATVDLWTVDADQVLQLVQETGEALGAEDGAPASVVLRATAGDPTVVVTMTGLDGEPYRTYSLDGTPR